MEILPGAGVASAKVGESRDVVERRVGPPVHPRRHSRAVYETSPMLVLTYTDEDLVEVVEIGYTGDGGEEIFFDGVQLTFRFIDDVVADLAAKGHRYEPIDIGYRFEPGFAIFSMGSRWAGDLDPAASEDNPRSVCEGVSVAPYHYYWWEGVIPSVHYSPRDWALFGQFAPFEQSMQATRSVPKPGSFTCTTPHLMCWPLTGA